MQDIPAPPVSTDLPFGCEQSSGWDHGVYQSGVGHLNHLLCSLVEVEWTPVERVRNT